MESPVKPELLSLPWATLLTLASGYAGYFIANVGIRDHHKPVDLFFSTLVFGFVSAFAFYTCRIIYDVSLVWSSGAQFLFAMMVGSAWSLFGRACFEWILRKTNISHSDDLPSAWVALFATRLAARQLSVKLKDGSWLRCDNLSKFKSSPNGPCVLGAKGDILMYVTHTQSDIGVDFFPCADPIDAEWGHEITYIPADQIVRVDLRQLP
jgi:hypothetical protein